MQKLSHANRDSRPANDSQLHELSEKLKENGMKEFFHYCQFLRQTKYSSEKKKVYVFFLSFD
jgi:hypothetical protein